MTFTTSNLVNDRVLVQGTDGNGVTNQTVIDGREWAEVKAHQEFNAADADFDKAVNEFFAPLVKAAEAREAVFKQEEDPLSLVILDEGEEGTPARARQVRRLSRDSMILRLIESGQDDRLVWVDSDLEILQKPVSPTRKSAPAKKASTRKTGAKS